MNQLDKQQLAAEATTAGVAVVRGRRCSMVQLRAAILEAEARADPALATAVAAYAAAAPPPVGAVLSGVAFNAFKAKDFNFLVGKRARAAGVSFNAGALSLGHALAMTIVEFLLARVPGVATPEWCLTAAHVRELADTVGRVLGVPVVEVPGPERSSIYVPRALETQKLLGVRQTIGLEESIRRVYDYLVRKL